MIKKKKLGEDIKVVTKTDKLNSIPATNRVQSSDSQTILTNCPLIPTQVL